MTKQMWQKVNNWWIWGNWEFLYTDVSFFKFEIIQKVQYTEKEWRISLEWIWNNLQNILSEKKLGAEEYI